MVRNVHGGGFGTAAVYRAYGSPAEPARAAAILGGMTLGRKMAYQTAAMIIGLLMISAASLWGINRLYADYAGVATEAYGQLREVYEIRSDVRAAEQLLATTPPQRELAG